MCVVTKALILVVVFSITRPKGSVSGTSVRLMGQPRVNLTAHPGDNVVLECEFDAEIDCVWKHDLPTSSPVKLGRKRNCSYTLNRVNTGQEGLWVCGTPGSSNEHHREYVRVNLTVLQQNALPTRVPDTTEHPPKLKTYFYLAVHPANKTFASGSSGILSCEFNAPVHCVWKLNGKRKRLNSGSDYYYTKYDKEHAIKDCSVHITNFKAAESGFWRCSNMGNDSTHAVSSYRATLTLENKDIGVTWIAGLVIGVLILAVNIILVVVLYQKRSIRLRSRQSSLDKL